MTSFGGEVRMCSVSHLGEGRRYSKGIRASKKSIFYSDYYDDDNKKEATPLVTQRSISLGALHQSANTLEPRMAQLENLEAKMASIEVSLSTTPRRKKSSSAATTPIPPSSIVPLGGNIFTTSPHSPSTYKEPPKETETLKHSHRDKENLIQSVKTNIWGTSPRVNKQGTLQEKERKAAQDRLLKLKTELDSQRLAIKNIKTSLASIDITDNIDVRIKQAELEYQLGREELNLLSIMEEIRNLQACLEEANVEQLTLFNYVGSSCVSVHAVELVYDGKSPQFGANSRAEGGLVVEWVADTCPLSKGDRFLEVNGKIVAGKGKEDLLRLLAVSPNPAQVVVMRKHAQEPEQIMSHLRAELSVVKEKAGEAERTRDSFRSDNVRLTHRISYLEEQVAELLKRARDTPPKVKAQPKEKAAAGVQVFQKGAQVALVSSSPQVTAEEKGEVKRSEDGKGGRAVDALLEKPKRKKEVQPARSTHSLEAERKHRQCHLIDGKEYRVDSENERVSKRATEHLHGEQRQKHLRDARTTLFSFMDRRHSGKYLDFDSEPTYLSGGSERGLEVRSEASLRHLKKYDKQRPVPPKKPLRLSLQRATSLQSMENSEKKTLKRTHKGEAPAAPQHKSHPNPPEPTSERWC